SFGLEEVAVRRGHEVLVGNLEVPLQGPEVLAPLLSLRFGREDLLEFKELAEALDRVQVDLDALKAIDLAGLSDLRLHGEHLAEDLQDRLRIRDRHKEDAALLHPADVRPLVVNELSLLRPDDGAEFQAPLSEGEVAVDLLDRGNVFRAGEEGSGLSELLVPSLELDEPFFGGIHSLGTGPAQKKLAMGHRLAAGRTDLDLEIG